MPEAQKLPEMQDVPEATQGTRHAGHLPPISHPYGPGIQIQSCIHTRSGQAHR